MVLPFPLPFAVGCKGVAIYCGNADVAENIGGNEFENEYAAVLGVLAIDLELSSLPIWKVVDEVFFDGDIVSFTSWSPGDPDDDGSLYMGALEELLFVGICTLNTGLITGLTFRLVFVSELMFPF